MAQIEKAQIKDIHVLGASMGMVERGNRDDDLHQLIAGITGKVSTTELTKAEAAQVLAELRNRMRLGSLTQEVAPVARPRRYQETPGGMTEGQQRKALRLMYELQDLDVTPSTATFGERLTGIIKKELGVDATPREPFRWLDHTQGGKLIDTMKRYVASAARKKARG